MILPAKKCQDCGAFVSCKLDFTDCGIPKAICPSCGAVHETESWYQTVTQEQALDIIHSRRPKGLFLFDTGVEIIGIDNTTGKAWVEELPDTRECLKWLSEGR